MVKNRLKKKLSNDDRVAITQALVDHLVTHDLEVEDISTTDDFIDCLFVRLAQYNPDWIGIRSVKDLKGTEVKKRLQEHVRNQKKKDSKINVQIDAARALREEATESDGSEMQVLVSGTHSPRA